MKWPEESNVQTQKVDQCLFRAGVRGEWEMIANGYETSFLDDDSVLELDCGDSSTTVDILKTIEC